MNFSPIYWLIVIWEQRTTPKREKKQEVVGGPGLSTLSTRPTLLLLHTVAYKTSKAKMKMVDYVLNYKKAALASRPPFTA